MNTEFDFNKSEKFDFDKVGKRMPYSTLRPKVSSRIWKLTFWRR